MGERAPWLVSSEDCRRYWEGKGLIAMLVRGKLFSKDYADHFCAGSCPDPGLKARLVADNKAKNDADCAKGKHFPALFSDPDKCWNCGVALPPSPITEYAWDKAFKGSAEI